jgi:hypothetical protein
MRNCRHRRIGHRHRADVAGLDLRRHVEPRRPRHRAHAGFLVEHVPDRAVQAGSDAPPHQRMPRRVEVDLVDAIAVRVEASERRREDVGDAAKLEGLRRPPLGAELDHLVHDGLRYAFHQRAKNRIALEKVKAGERRRLVEDLVRICWRNQKPPPHRRLPAIRPLSG